MRQEPEIVAVKKDGSEADGAVLEEAGIAFDPAQQHLDLSKEEKRRTTALLLAIQAYSHLIIKDAEYYREVKREEAGGGSKIQPATISAMVSAAIEFDLFIQGDSENATACRIALEFPEPEQEDVPE